MIRYPQWSAGGLLRAGDYFGTVCFAMTGTLTAAAHGLDFLGGDSCLAHIISPTGNMKEGTPPPDSGRCAIFI